MPWSPLKYADQIFSNLKNRGFVEEVTTQELSTEIMRVTGLIRPQTIRNVIRAFEQLGYIKHKSGDVWAIAYAKD